MNGADLFIQNLFLHPSGCDSVGSGPVQDGTMLPYSLVQLFSKREIVGENSDTFALSIPISDLLCAAEGAAG